MHYISGEHLSLEIIGTILKEQHTLALSEEAEQRIVLCHEYLQHKISTSEQSIYGINTGFGALCQKKSPSPTWSSCSAT